MFSIIAARMVDLGIEEPNTKRTICRSVELSWIWWRTENPSRETTLEFEVAYDLILMCVGYYELFTVVLLCLVSLLHLLSLLIKQGK